MKTMSTDAAAPGALALCCAAAAGFGTVLATQGWLIVKARQRIAGHRSPPPPAHAPPQACEGRAPTRFLVVGDSTGVGIGSGTSAQNLQGRLHRDFAGAEIVNLAHVGARVSDVNQQLAPLRRADERFDFALVLVGGNDILQMTPLARLAEDARAMLGALHQIATTVVWIGCADIGIAPCFIAPFTWFFSHRSRLASRRFAAAARAAGVDFIDFVDHPLSADFRRRRDRYFAADGVHPSGFAYGRCYEVLKARPELSALVEQQRRAA